jgi:tetratricopeptide (TPR) repeat protein
MAVSFDCTAAYPQAVSCLRKILSMKAAPGQVGVDFRAARIKAWLRLMRILTEQKLIAEARDAADAAVPDCPDRPEISLMAGKVFLAAGKPIEALRLFEKSLSLTVRDNLDSYIGLCLIYVRAGRRETAQESLESVRPLFETLPRYWAFRKHFLGDAGVPETFKEEELKSEWEKIQGDFFGAA